MGLFDSSQKQRTLGWKPARKFLKNQFMPRLEDFESRFGGGEGLWSGSSLAALDPLVTQGQESILSAIPGLQEQFGQVGSTLEGFLDSDPNSALNQARRAALSDNITATFNQSIRPGIENRGTFAGQFGGPQQAIAMGAATQPLSRAIADAEVAMMEGDRNRAFQAMGLAPGLFGQLATMPGSLMGQIGNERSLRSQAELMDKISQFEAPMTNQARAMGLTQSMTMPLLQAGSTTSSSSSASPFQSLVGAGLMAAGMGFNPMSMFSGGVSSMVPSTGVPGLNYAVPFSGGSNL